ncbi:acyltransferase [Alicyclobacillus sp. SO9]|uniref:acyltransferase n=1 Tax=Alicyclobacillus sp. SO9 TaxID=2665646 RepID=UPI0018E73E6E|nr:acyltransferase [Alicyclobacillus sp. SO9]QQE80981.1 acyltransferase [Alicyclobacillus sp. SO9]
MGAKKHLYEIDLMRAFIMLGVLSVHTIVAYIGMLPSSVYVPHLTLAALLTSLHFTRESFMFITGLVLFVTYYHREFHPLQFWKKRFLFVATPYVVWNLVYILFEGSYTHPFSWSLSYIVRDWIHSLLAGNQFFLYYVLVTLQLYVVFPALLLILRKLERWHLQVLIISFATQLVLMYLNKYVITGINANTLPPVLKELDIYRAKFVLTYQFWFVAGGVTACHYQKLLEFARHHTRTIYISLFVGLVGIYGNYFFDIFVLHQSIQTAQSVLRPNMVVYSIIITLFMWYTGLLWAERRQRANWRPFSRFVQIAADASFGIFLLQPFSLYVMNVIIQHLQVPLWVHFATIPLSILFVYFSAMFIAHWMGKIPVISYCVGRKAVIKRKNSPSVSAQVSQ